MQEDQRHKASSAEKVREKRSESPTPPGRGRLWSSPRSGKIAVLAAAIAAALVAFFLRAFHIAQSWDIFVDEPIYLQISKNVMVHQYVSFNGRTPFYLHPPGLFFLEAAYLRLFGIHGDLVHQIYEVRYLSAALAGLSTGALLWLGRQLAGWPAGIVVAMIFALDPFSTRMNSLNMIETPTMLWVLLGYGVLFSALVREPATLTRPRAILGGVLFGFALLTKEESAFATLLPLGVCFALDWALPRTRSALIGLVALLVYLPYPVTAYAIGDWDQFVSQKFAGISRLVGIMHPTGFHKHGPSFLSAILHRLSEFATTYAFLATGGIAICILLFTSIGKTPARRLLLAWSGSAYAFLAYAVLYGTLEEQFFYYLVIPSMLITVVTAALVLQEMRTAGSRQRWQPVLRVAVTAFLAAFVLWSVHVWYVVHTVPDNGYQRVISYIQRLPRDSRVVATSDTLRYLLKRTGGKTYDSISGLRSSGADYVVVSSYLVNKGYKNPPPGVYRWVKDHGQLAYGIRDRSSGLVGVWHLQHTRASSGSVPKGPADEAGHATRAAGTQAKAAGAYPVGRSRPSRHSRLNDGGVRYAAPRTLPESGGINPVILLSAVALLATGTSLILHTMKLRRGRW